MKNKESLQLKVANQLKNDPLLKDAEIAVDVCSNEVIVTGVVNKFFKKAMVYKVVNEVMRIKKVTDHIEVLLASPNQFSDVDILKAVLDKFERNFGNSHKNIEVTIKDGVVALEGTVKWKYQKLLATECITYVDGIVNIQNNIMIAETPEPNICEKDILAAIYKEESVTSDISVDLNGRKVILVGNVATPFQKKLIEKIVRDIPGVQEIESKLQIVKEKS
jgi:osmotically-inducible protein OsmY